MSTSFPSPCINILDVPEVNDFRASFVYDFFTPDESHNDSSVAPPSVKRLPAESFDAERIENVRRVVPRFVRFDFTPKAVSQDVLMGNEFISHISNRGKFSIAKNLANIQSEEEFSGKTFTGLEFQDSNIDKKLFTLVSGSIAKRVAAKNRNIQNQIDENRQTVLNALSDEYSLMDAAKALADDTSETVSNNTVVNALNQIDALKLLFIDETGQKQLIDNTFESAKNVAIKGQISNRLIGRIVKNIVNDPMSQFSDEFVNLQPKTSARETEAKGRFKPNTIRAGEFNTHFKAIERSTIDAHDTPASTHIIGYIIEKSEITADGNLKKHPSIIIENGSQSTAVDTNVAYGHTYIYTIRTVAQLKVKATQDNNDDIVLASGLAQSRRSARVFVKCVENIPPPSIADFNVMWNYSASAPMLIWSFPTNPQRDIKRFQVFRRSSINEPFQLIRELDFDDSDVRINGDETPAPELVEKLKSPVTSFLDTEFIRDAKYIYAVCSIDAHGLSSNYSIQMEITFDTFKNKIKKKLISNAGAPKSYPNMTLLQDTFVDTLKVSDHTRVRVVFDPEYLNVFDSRGNDMGLLVTDKIAGDAKYRLQLINVDIQRQEVVDIKIQDRRAPKASGL